MIPSNLSDEELLARVRCDENATETERELARRLAEAVDASDCCDACPRTAKLPTPTKGHNMSIEKLIEENTAALTALTVAIQAAGLTTANTLPEKPSGNRPAVLPPILPEEPAVKKPTSGKPSSGTAKEPPASSAPSATGAAIESSATPEVFDFAVLAEAGINLVQAGHREALVAILAEYNVPKLSALPESAWSDVYGRIRAAQRAAT